MMQVLERLYAEVEEQQQMSIQNEVADIIHQILGNQPQKGNYLNT